MTEQFTGWFSAYMAERTGTAWWLTSDGEEVEVTVVTHGTDTDKRPNGYDDEVRLGTVVEFVRPGRTGYFWAVGSMNPAPEPTDILPQDRFWY